MAFNKGLAFSQTQFGRHGRKLEKMLPEVRGQAARNLSRALAVAAVALGRTWEARQVVHVVIAEVQRRARGLLTQT